MNLTNGNVSFNSSNLDFGTYNITVVLDDNNFNFINETVSFNISHYTSQITVDVDNINVGEVLKVSVKIISASEVKATGNLTIKIGDIIKTSDIGSGVLNYSISDLKYGDYVIIVTYGGDELHTEQTANKTFSVSRFAPSIIVSKSIKYGDGINFKLSNGMTGNITVNINNIDYNINYNSYGFYVPILNLTIGNYDLKVIFDGDDKFISLNLFQSLVITKMETIFTASAVSTNILTAKCGLSYSVTLKNLNNDFIPSKTVKITFNNRQYTAITNSKGIAIFKLYSTSTGVKQAKIVFNGDNTFTSASLNRNFNIVKVKNALKVTKKTYKKFANQKSFKLHSKMFRVK